MNRPRCARPVSHAEVVRVVVGRFDPLLTHGLVNALGADDRLRVLDSGLEPATLERVVDRHKPPVAIVDESVGCALLSRFASNTPPTGVLVLAGAPTHLYHELLRNAGATCLSRSAEIPDILAAVHLVANGFEPAAEGDVETPGGSPLTRRQLEVFEHLRDGHGYSRVAADLGLGIATVRTHARHLFAALGVTSKQDLIGMTLPHESKRLDSPRG